MYSSWIPQNIQKRLLLYILQQLSLFSEVDLPNLEEVSLNNIHLRSVSIDPEKFDKIPGFRLRHGTIRDFILTGGVVDGINVDITGVDLVVAPSFDNIKQDLKDVETSLAQSTAELSQVIIDDGIIDSANNNGLIDDSNDTSAISSGESSPQDKSAETFPETPASADSQRKSSFSGGVMTKALDMALSRIRVSVKDIKIKFVVDSIDLEFSIDKISFESKNGLRSLSFLGISASTLKSNVNPGNRGVENNSSSNNDSPASSDSESSESGCDSDEAELMESKMFSKEEASSIYMSAISSHLDKTSVSEPSDSPSNRVMLFSIDKIDAELEKLFPFSDLRLDIGTINVAAVPLVPTLTAIFNSLSRTVKLKNHQLRKTNFAQRASRSKGETTTKDFIEDRYPEGSHQIFDNIKIHYINLGVTSSLTPQGDFASTKDDLELVFKNFTVKQKGNDLIYGGVETLTALKFSDGVESKVFHFDELDSGELTTEMKTLNASKADVRFEYSTNKANDEKPIESSDTELTILLHKPGKFESNVTSLQHLLNLSIALNSLNEDFSTFMRDLRLMSELSNDTKSAIQWNANYKDNIAVQKKEEGKSQILFQTASLDVTLLFSENTALKTTIFPISFDKVRDHFYIHRVVSSYITHGEQIKVMTIPRISLRLEPKEFEAYKFSANKEVPEKKILNGALSIHIGDIEISMDHKIFEALISDAKLFVGVLKSRHHCINSFESSSNKAFSDNHQRNFAKSSIMNAGRSMRGNSGQVKFGERKAPQAKLRISLKSVHIKIRDIFNALGDADIKLLDSMFYQLNTGMIGSVGSVRISRILDEKQEPVVSSCLAEEYPMVHISLSESRPAPEIIFRRFQIDYYTIWLQTIQDFRQSSQKPDTSKSSYLDPLSGQKDNKAKKEFGDTNLESHEIRPDAANFEVHCTSHNLVLSISPLRLPSQLICAITKGTIYFTTSKGNLSVKHTFRDVNVLLIDEISNFRASSTSKNSRFTPHLISGGYSSIGIISTLHLGLNILQSTSHGSISESETKPSTLDVNINVDNVRTSLCADSCHTLLQTVNDFKVPVVFSDEDRCRVKVDSGFHLPENILDELQALANNGAVKTEHTVPGENEPDTNSHAPVTNAKSLSIVDEYCDIAKTQTRISPTNSKTDSETASDEDKESSPTSIEFSESHFYQKERESEATPHSLILKLNVSEIESYLHDGYDWKSTRKSLADSIKTLKNRAKELKEKNREKEASRLPESMSKIVPESGTMDVNPASNADDNIHSEVSDTLFKSIHISADVNSDETNLVELINCQLQGDTAKEVHTNVDVKGRIKDLKLKRSQTHKAKVEIKNLSAYFTNYTSRDPRFDPTPQDLMVEALNKLELSIGDLTIFDNVATSSWNKFVTYMNILGDRELGTEMINLIMTNVRPDARLAFAEALIKLKVLPLRLYVDQDTLAFFTRFFEFKDTRFAQPVEDPVYIQKLEIDGLRMKFDYKPKKIDFNGIRRGKNAELANFFALDGSDLSLKRAVVYGVHGFSKVGEALGQVYAPYIRKSQIFGLLSGLPPVKSIFNFKNGVKDLVTIPLEEYKRDGRLLYGLQKGTKSFAKITTSELLRIGVKIASGTQLILENSEEYFGGEGTTARRYSFETREKANVEQPKDHSKREKKPTSSSPRMSGKKNLLETSQILKNSVLGDGDIKSKPRRYLQASIVEEENSDVDVAQDEFNSATLGSDLGDLQSSVLLVDDSEDSEALSEDSFEEEGQHEEENQKKLTSLYSNQPANSGEGLKSAYASLGKNLSKTKRMLVDLKDELREADSYQEQLTSIAKSSPVIIIRPIIGTTEAVMKTLMGVSNGIDSRPLVENQDKYRQDEVHET